ncbi:MAG: ankyrin repeat domain-containing protein [Candidatus Cloacimonetes bacterium]|nr:ankyrin repeat domain-containing protein [Candidatus Cloacimonadota bacterium]
MNCKTKALITCCIFLAICPFLEAGNLFDYIEINDLDNVKRIIMDHPDSLEAISHRGLSPVNHAALKGNLEMVRFLSEQGADLLRGDNENSCALHNAAAQNHFEVVRFLVEQGVDINIQDDNDTTPMIFAVVHDNPEMISYLLEQGADPAIANINGNTAFLNSMFSGNLAIVKMIRERIPNINETNLWGVNALIYTAWKGYGEIVDYLIEEGVDIHHFSNSGENALVWAVVAERFEIAEKLMQHGLSMQDRDQFGRTPLFAAYKSSLESVKFMLEQGAEINAADSTGNIPLHMAAWRGSTEVVDYLLTRGADINIRADNGWTPLLNAVLGDSLEMVKLLLDHGAAINQDCVAGQDDCRLLDGSPLHIAAKRGNSEVADLLIQYKADLNIKDEKWGCTPLHYAAMLGKTGIISLLAEQGADLNCRDELEHTPAYYAIRFSHPDIAEYLTARGAETGKVEELYARDLLSEKLQDGEAYIWYLYHSAIALKTKEHLLIFDYFNPETAPAEPSINNGWIVPAEISDQDVIVFVSHQHRDHYDPVIFEWKQEIPGITYIMGFDPGLAQEYVVLEGRSDAEINGVKIHTIASNDSGVGFLVQVDGVNFLHIGDHANRERDFSGNYLTEIEYLKELNIPVDVSAMPISGCGFRDLEAVRLGVYRTIEILKPGMLLPVHAGSDTYRYREFARQMKENNVEIPVLNAVSMGDRFHFQKGKLIR